VLVLSVFKESATKTNPAKAALSKTALSYAKYDRWPAAGFAGGGAVTGAGATGANEATGADDAAGTGSAWAGGVSTTSGPGGGAAGQLAAAGAGQTELSSNTTTLQPASHKPKQPSPMARQMLIRVLSIVCFTTMRGFLALPVTTGIDRL
jgi:hypothetical protein